MCVFVHASRHVIRGGGIEREVQCASDKVLCFCVRESRDTDILAQDEWEEGWMRLARVWRELSRCKLEKFPYGSKMSATLLIGFLMCARCCWDALRST